MRRSAQVSLLLTIAVAVGALAATLAAGNAPELGLDLQGGASVVLRPTRQVSDSILDQSIAIIRNRVDALGVAEPDISRQGSNIVVQMPGVKNRDRALAIVGQTAQLRFRPVLQPLPPETGTGSTTTVATTTTAPASTTTTRRGATTTTAAPTTTTTTPADIPNTSREDDTPTAIVVLPDKDRTQRYRLGPTELSGRAVRTARAVAPQAAEGWSVEVVFTSAGGKQFDEVAKRFFNQQMAIVLDGVVQSAPTITSQDFGGRASITGGTGGFGEGEAKDLALVLRYGALPVTLRQETVQTVSASLGKDSLRAGVGAGLVGLALVLFVAGSIFAGVWLAFVGWFLLQAAGAETQQVTVEERLAGRTVADLMRRDPVVVPPELPLGRFVDEVVWSQRYTTYPVVEDGAPVGLLPFRAVAEAPRGEWDATRVRDRMLPLEQVPALTPSDPLAEALQRLAASDVRRALVVEDGRLVGLLSISDLLLALELGPPQR